MQSLACLHNDIYIAFNTLLVTCCGRSYSGLFFLLQSKKDKELSSNPYLKALQKSWWGRDTCKVGVVFPEQPDLEHRLIEPENKYSLSQW